MSDPIPPPCPRCVEQFNFGRAFERTAIANYAEHIAAIDPGFPPVEQAFKDGAKESLEHFAQAVRGGLATPGDPLPSRLQALLKVLPFASRSILRRLALQMKEPGEE